MSIRRFQHRLTAFLSCTFWGVVFVLVGADSADLAVVLRTNTVLFLEPLVSVFGVVSVTGFGVFDTAVCSGIASTVDDTNKPVVISEGAR